MSLTCDVPNGVCMHGDSMSDFYIQGIQIDPLETAPVGWTESLLVEIEGLPGGTVQVDRFDCRLLLDSVELSRQLTCSSIHKVEEEEEEEEEDSVEREIDDIRYGDLYVEEESVERRGNEFHFTYGTDIWIAPPPPFAPSVVRQITDVRDECSAVCCGPCSLRELAVIHAVVKYVAKKAGGVKQVEDRTCDELKGIPDMEFLNRDHQHHCIFVDMLSQVSSKERWNDVAGMPSLDALREYEDDVHTKADKVPLMTRLLSRMVEDVPNTATLNTILARIEQGHTWLNASTCTEYQSLVERLKRRLIDDEEKITTSEKEEDPGTLMDTYPFDLDGETNVDESTRASRLLKAQMMMKKRRVEHDEKSKVIRAQTVQEDTTRRQRQIAQIAHHRKMFEDSDDD